MKTIGEDDAIRGLGHQLRTLTLGGYFAVTPYGAMTIRRMSSPTMADLVPEAHKILADSLCHRLNREIAEGGKWIVAWTEFDLGEGMPRRLSMLWADADGDVNFVVDAEDHIAIAVHGEDDYLQQCAEAHRAWKESMYRLAPRADQKKRFAQGEQSEDPSAMPDVMPVH